MSVRIAAIYVLNIVGIAAVQVVVLALFAPLGSPIDWPRALAAIGVASLVAGTFIATLVTRLIMRPINSLARGMYEVAQGRFDTRVDEREGAPIRGIIEDFNEMTSALLAVESLRESFVSNVAHEFKTPLSYMQGYATLLQDEDLTTEQRREYAGHITAATRRLADMIGNLLEISNLSRPGAPFEAEAFALDEQLRHVIALFVPQMTNKGIEFEVDLRDVVVEGNKSLLEDVWTNLLSNAVKYTPAGGTIRVSLEQRDGQALVTVADTGCGMTPEQVSHAFDRFYQGDETHVGEGSGLGLAIVKAVLKKHAGWAEIESAPGQGTKLIVQLPLAHT